MLLLSFAKGKTIYTSRPFGDTNAILSGAASALRKYVEDLLPPGFYKDHWISTELPYFPGMNAAQRRRRTRGAILSNVERRSFPLLSIRVDPRADSSEFSTQSGFWRSTSFTNRPQTLNRFLHDDENHIYGGLETDRITTAFNVSTIVETDLQAYNLQMLYKKILPNGIWMFLNDVDIGVDIPGDILLVLWRALNLGDDFKKPENSTSQTPMVKFEKYLLSSTEGRVRRVLNPRTGNNSFSWNYKTNIAFRIDSRPAVSIERAGNVVKRALVDFEILFDYYSPLAFSLETTDNSRMLLPSSGEVMTYGDIDDIGKKGGYDALGGAGVRWRSPVRFLPKHRYGEDYHLSLIHFCTFITGTDEEDETDLSEALPNEVYEYIKYLKKKHTEMNVYRDKINISVWEGYDTQTSSLLSVGDSMEDPLDGFIRTKKIKINNTKKEHEHHISLFADLADVENFEKETRKKTTELVPVKWL